MNTTSYYTESWNTTFINFTTTFISNQTTAFNQTTVPMFLSPVPYWGTILIAAGGCFFLLVTLLCALFCVCRCRPTNRKFQKISMDNNLNDYVAMRSNQPVMEDLEHKEHGVLFYSLDFNLKNSKLMVGVKKIEGLPGTIFSKPLNPFVRVRLGPNLFTQETKVTPFSRNPTYNEIFTFPMQMKKQAVSVVMFSVYDHQLFRRHIKLGQFQVALQNISLADLVEDMAALEAPVKNEEENDTGEVCVSLRYIPTKKKLDVIIIEAKNLWTQENSYKDPYVKVYLLVDEKIVKKKTTKTKTVSDANPYFNELFSFSVDPTKIMKTSLIIRVAFKKNIVLMSKNIGETIISGTKIGTGYKQWLDITGKPGYPLAMWHSLLPCEG